jgi:hypothetical protein
MRSLGRSLQTLALLLLPASMILEISGALGRAFGLSQLLLLMLFGIAAFLLGRYLEAYA